MNKIEIFSAGCSFCNEAIELIKGKACVSCEVIVHDLHDPKALEHTKKYGVKRAPAVVVNGILSPCCKCHDIELDV